MLPDTVKRIVWITARKFGKVMGWSPAEVRKAVYHNGLILDEFSKERGERKICISCLRPDALMRYLIDELKPFERAPQTTTEPEMPILEAVLEALKDPIIANYLQFPEFQKAGINRYFEIILATQNLKGKELEEACRNNDISIQTAWRLRKRVNRSNNDLFTALKTGYWKNRGKKKTAGR